MCPAAVGYERFPDSAEFAAHLHRRGVARLVDVRELPISRRRGYAKTALSEALGEKGIEYVHMRGLGNPKPIRDLYKSGAVEEGRRLYREHLLGNQRDQLDALRSLLEDKPTALMWLEHDQEACHRDVIIEALARGSSWRLIAWRRRLRAAHGSAEGAIAATFH